MRPVPLPPPPRPPSATRLRALVAAACLLGASVPATAHDFWLEPGAHRLEARGDVTLALRVGEGFVGEPVPRQAARLVAFVVAGPSGDVEVRGEEGADPAGTATLEAPGLYVAAYRSTARRIELEAAKFEAYLLEEGLEHVVEDRRARGESKRPGVEAYARGAKTFVRVGPEAGASAGHDRVFGFPFELVPLSDPLATEAGGTLAVRALVDGKPAAGLRVGLMRREDGKDAASGRTDDRGELRLAVPHAGAWLVHAVTMRRAAPATGVDWESHWASLTFATRPAPR